MADETMAGTAAWVNGCHPAHRHPRLHPTPRPFHSTAPPPPHPASKNTASLRAPNHPLRPRLRSIRAARDASKIAARAEPLRSHHLEPQRRAPPIFHRRIPAGASHHPALLAAVPNAIRSRSLPTLFSSSPHHRQPRSSLRTFLHLPVTAAPPKIPGGPILDTPQPAPLHRDRSHGGRASAVDLRRARNGCGARCEHRSASRPPRVPLRHQRVPERFKSAVTR